ncbi:MAG: DUF4397 domain-containing protein [Terriglobales bacterium]
MSRLLTILTFALAVIAIGMLAASCGSGNAQYRVVNAIPNTAQNFNSNGFDMQMNGTTVWTSVGFGSTEPSPQNKYQNVSSGTDTLGVYLAGQAGQSGAVPVVSSALDLGGGTQYTVILAGNSDQSGATYPLVAHVITDSNPTPTSGDVGIRILDASLALSSLGSVDVLSLPSGDQCCAGASTVASALQYPQNGGTGGNIDGGYQNIGIPPSGHLTLWVTAHGNTSDIIFNYTISSLSAGQNYTLVMADATGGGSPPQFFFLTP